MQLHLQMNILVIVLTPLMMPCSSVDLNHGGTSAGIKQIRAVPAPHMLLNSQAQKSNVTKKNLVRRESQGLELASLRSHEYTALDSKDHKVVEIAAIGQALPMRRSTSLNHASGISSISVPTSATMALFTMDRLGKLQEESAHVMRTKMQNKQYENPESDKDEMFSHKHDSVVRKFRANVTQRHSERNPQALIQATQATGSTLSWCLITLFVSLICIAVVLCKTHVSRMLCSLDRSLDDEARRAVSRIFQDGDSIGLLDAFQVAGMPPDSRYSELFEIEYGKEDSKMQAKQLFEALSNRNDRKPILLRPGWDTLCVRLKGTVATSAGASYLLRDASVAEHDWLLSQIDAEIVNETTFIAIFKVVVMWRIVRTIGRVKVSNELWNRVCWWLRCEEPIAVTECNVWIDIEGVGIAFYMLWGNPSPTSQTASTHGTRPYVERVNSLPDAAPMPAATRVVEYEGMESARAMESERPDPEFEEDVLDATARRLPKVRKKLLRKKENDQRESTKLDEKEQDLQ